MNICHTCQVRTSDRAELTIDELASVAGTTTRRIRSFQTLGLLPHPELRGRTGLYGPLHRARLAAILRLQDRGFSLESQGVLFGALEAGRSLAEVLGVTEPAAPGDPGTDADRGHRRALRLRRAPTRCGAPRRGRGRPLLSVVPTTVWDESEAS